MRKHNPLLIFLLVCFSGLFLFTCNRKDDLVDANNDVLRKSFPEIKILDIAEASNEARVTFNVTDVERNDPIVQKWILYWPEGAQVGDTTELPVTPIINNFGTIINLNAGTNYVCQIKLRTSAEDENNEFFSETKSFETSKLDIIIDGFIEDEQNLKVTAIALIEKFDQVAANYITGIGFRWRNILDHSEVILTEPMEPVSETGLFNAELRFFDYTKNYEVAAFAKLIDGDTSFSVLDTFATESKGDFWVDISELPSYVNQTNQEMGTPFDNVTGLEDLEGAVSFELNGMIYLGLGRKGDASNYTYPQQFYKYDPLLNKWTELAQSLDFPGNNNGRMFATSFKAIENGQEVIFVGGGCQNCDAYDDYNGEDNLDQIPDIQFLNDFYYFDGSSWEPAASLTNQQRRFSAYGFSNASGKFIGGGLYKGLKEGDIKTGINLENYIDVGEWHNLNNNLDIDYKVFIPEIKIEQNELCSTFNSPVVNQVFCVDCVCIGDDCPTTESLQYKVHYDTMGQTREYNIELVGTVSDSVFVSEEVFDIPVERRITLDLYIDGDYDTPYEWVDINRNGEIDNTDTMDTDEVVGLVSTGSINFIEIINVDGVVVWHKDITALGNNVKIDLNYGTFCCDRSNSYINKSALYYNTSNPEYDEWIDTNPNNIPDTLEELSFELIVNTDLLQLIGNEWVPLQNVNSNATRFAASIWPISSNEVYLAGGDNTIPQENTQNNILKFSSNNWQVEPSAMDIDFKKREHAFSFVINENGILKSYIGGGEIGDDPLNLDLWRFYKDDPMEPFKQVTGCGVNSLTRGVGFSANGNGFVFGEDEGGARVFWIYVPEIEVN